MPTTCRARQIGPQIYAALPVGGVLRSISARSPRDVNRQVEHDSVRGQALTQSNLELVSGICQINLQRLRQALR
jgi:hypothetical protein